MKTHRESSALTTALLLTSLNGRRFSLGLFLLRNPVGIGNPHRQNYCAQQAICRPFDMTLLLRRQNNRIGAHLPQKDIGSYRNIRAKERQRDVRSDY
ncbi:hypothetical protein N7540_000089 [Penicillium herquei]|nr:hypothetical protein N7540_000089 [Penicillium herquei]